MALKKFDYVSADWIHPVQTTLVTTSTRIYDITTQNTSIQMHK